MKNHSYDSRLIDWNRDEGFGHLSFDDHVIKIAAKDFLRFHRVPMEGDRILHNTAYDDNDRVFARDGVLLRAGGLFHDIRPMWPTLFLILPIVAFLLQPYPFSLWYSLAWLLVVSVATFLLYHCKDFLRSGIGRIRPDSALHFLELMGGWPGSLLAQRRLHIFESDRRYQVFFWITVGLWQGLAIDAICDWSVTRVTWGQVTPLIDRVLLLA